MGCLSTRLFKAIRIKLSAAVYGWAFSWRFQLHYRRPCPTSAAGHRVTASVIGTAMKMCIHKHLTHPDTDTAEYLRKFSKKFETDPTEYSAARGTLIRAKKPEVENPVSDSL